MKNQYLQTALLVATSLFLYSCKDTNKTKESPVVEQLRDELKMGGLGPKLIKIPGGEGTIGGKNFRSFRNEEPIKKVKIAYDYYLSETEITFEQFDIYCKATKTRCPSDRDWGRGKHPVTRVSWDNAVAYTKWLSEQSGYTYRLPSEAEWEYAARAGKSSKFWWGNEYETGKDHCDRDVGQCPTGTDLGRPALVKSFNPNPFGLYDMTSNLSEWVLDCESESHNSLPLDGSPNLSGDCSSRMLKGGNWKNPQPYVHLSKRFPFEKYQFGGTGIGFRILREVKANP